MSKHIIFICVLISFSFSSSAQFVYQKTIGSALAWENGASVKATNDGGYIIDGESDALAGSYNDAYLVKTDANGDTLWARIYGGFNIDTGTDVEQTSDSGYVLTGYTTDFITNNTDVFLIKTNSTGDTLWTKTYGGNGPDWGYSVKQTPDGGFVIAGTTQSFNINNNDIYVIKTDSNGDTLWTKTYGGSMDENGTSIQVTNDSGFIICGNTESFGNYSQEYLLKTDSIGQLEWSKTYGGVSYETTQSVQQTNDGGYVLTGITGSFGLGGTGVYLVKTNDLGDTLWTKVYSTAGQDVANMVKQSSDNGYIITGSTTPSFAVNQQGFLIKTDSTGNLIWSKLYGGTDSEDFKAVLQTPDKGFLLIGTSYSFGLDYNIYFVKTDSLGYSGCYESNGVFVSDTTATLVGSAATIESNPPTENMNHVLYVYDAIAFSNETVLCSTVGIADDEDENFISVAPNPSFGEFTVKWAQNSPDMFISVFSILGNEVYKEEITGKFNTTIKLENIKSGIYFLKMEAGNKQSIRKIVIE